MTCARRTVTAHATVGGVEYVGTNWCRNPQKVCPRGDVPTGVDWWKCEEVCKINGHAEIDLIRRVGGDLKGADVEICGHHYACDDCLDALKKANAGAIVFPQLKEEVGE